MRIRSALLGLAAATVAPLLVLFLLSAQYVYDLETQGVEESALARNRATLEAVDSEIRGSFAALRAFATSHALARGDFEMFRGEMSDVLATEPSWQNIVLSTPDGRQILNSRVEQTSVLPPSPDEPVSFQEAVRTRGPVVGNVTIAPLLQNEPGICVRLPILQHGSLVYILTAVINPSAFQTILARERVPQNSVTGLVGTDGHIIARIPAVPSGRPASPDYLAAVSGAREGWYRGKTIEGNDTYTSFAHSDLTGWSLGYAVPTKVVASGARRSIYFLILGLILSVALALYIGIHLARRIAGPIRSIAQAAQAVALPSVNPVISSKILEIEQLSQAIHDKDSRLLDSYATLEVQAQELETKNVNRSRFLALLSHELRNPLAPLRNGLAALKLRPDGPHRERLEALMERQINQMSRLIGDLLDLGRIDQGQIELKLSTVDLRSVASNAIDGARSLIEDRAHRLLSDLPSEPVWIFGDEVRLEQVVGNLLTNAAKYTKPGGVITLQIQSKAGYGILSVRDTGIGFAPDDSGRLFEMFTRLPNAKVADSGGLSIGLSLAKTLIDLHHGVLTASSAGIGKGAEFLVSLPLTLDTPATTNQPSAKESLGDSHRVLVVDDNRDAAETLAELLRLHDIEVDVAYDGATAIKKLPSKPAVAFVDLNMPGATGYQVAEYVRNTNWGQDIVLVAVTGMYQAEDFAATKASGFDAHLVKPAVLEELVKLATMTRAQAGAWMQASESGTNSS
jgi:signal transduction histidine kinase/CheY-like chemotaxis protein